MRTTDCDILMVPGYESAGSDHWQSRWQQRLSSARRVEQDDWDRPARDSWVARLVGAVEGCRRPVVLVAHSLGVAAVVHAAPRFPPGIVRGAFLVALPDVEGADTRPVDVDPSFAPLPGEPLPFPSLLVASRSDPYCAFERAEDFAYAWGSALLDAGDAGHLNVASGYGPWPEGLMRFAGFLRRL
jgi:predicted alpha/beta hydrolase family esterase